MRAKVTHRNIQYLRAPAANSNVSGDSDPPTPYSQSRFNLSLPGCWQMTGAAMLEEARLCGLPGTISAKGKPTLQFSDKR
jgi:hypothetical protein